LQPTAQPSPGVHKRVLRAATCLIALTCLALLLFPHAATQAISSATAAAMQWLDTPILWLTTALLLLCLVLAAGPWGKLRLGAADEQPEFGTASWLAMLFAAGMGSGLVFWGVAEPLTHWVDPPPGALGESSPQGMAFAATYFHWGLHAWAIYAIAGLAIAWFSYRHGAAEAPSGALRTGLHGLLPDAVLQKLGALADVLAIVAVVFGVAAALANGTLLLHQGLGQASNLDTNRSVAYGIILLAMAVAFLASASSGLRRGIRWLSAGNMLLAVLLMLLVIFNANQGAIVQALAQGIEQYLKILGRWSLQVQEADGHRDWAHGWTITYLLWWIAWAPFVGVFIARISRGRSIRSFLLGVLGVPVLFSLIWFAVLGGGAMAWDAEHDGRLAQLVQIDYTAPVFAWFKGFPPHTADLGMMMIWMVCLLLFIFLVTSADSAAYVLGMLGSGGDPNPARTAIFMWGGLTVLLAAGLLALDSADVNKAVAVVGAIPYAVLLALQVLALLRSFWAELRAKSPNGDPPSTSSVHSGKSVTKKTQKS